MKTPACATALALLLAAGAAGATEEVPFITTPDRVTRTMLEIADVGARDRVIDLGSGDGRIVITAARRHGARGLGVEIDPALVERSRDNARRAGVADRTEFREQDLFKTDLAAVTVVTMYLLPDVNLALRPALLRLAPGTRIVSHDWDMADWLPDRTITVDVPEKAIGREKLSRVHLWIVPAPVAGLWCGPRGRDHLRDAPSGVRPRGGPAGSRTLRLEQHFQRVQGRAEASPQDSTAVWGGLDGAALHLTARTGTLRLAVAGDAARVTAATGTWASWRGLRFTRSAGADCPA